jgi:uncharacterized LabA/DUF88 family protein
MKIFIQLDVQNLFFAAKDIGKRIDFKKIKDHFDATGDEIVAITAYIVRTPEVNSEKFENLLKMLGYELNIKHAIITYDQGGSKHYKGTDQDIAICIDCMDSIKKFDKWVLMSGDGDFIDLCNRLRGDNKNVEVWTMPGKSFNKRICDHVDSIKFLSEDFFLDNNNKGDSK